MVLYGTAWLSTHPLTVHPSTIGASSSLVKLVLLAPLQMCCRTRLPRLAESGRRLRVDAGRV